MRTTVEINDALLKEVIMQSGEKTKKAAIVTAMKDYLRFKKLQELKGLIGNYEEFGLTLTDLKKMRDER